MSPKSSPTKDAVRDSDNVLNRLQPSARCRDLVRAAAYSVKNRIARSWLVDDSRGTWEGEAARLLNRSAERAAELKLTDAQVDEAIIVELAILALTAVREHLVKKKKKKR